MAATNAAGGASLLAGIPGLTRTYGPGEKEPTFAELLAACTSSAVHLEIHDVHLTSDPAYQAWLAGQADPQESAQQYRAYTDVVVPAVRRGVAVRRARIVSEPVSDYVRWEHWLTGPGQHRGWRAGPVAAPAACLHPGVTGQPVLGIR